ncbi:MAG: hypothetical protein FJW32_10035 [Acidobacteria bacterium]|nr:hypothetical protein [Acidobacteriota bacterium]
MTRSQLEHIIRASAIIADSDEIVVIGSQAILGQFPDAPEELRISREADVYPLRHPERADAIDGSIGQDSPFDRTFGYHAHGVGPETAVLPRGWESRLVPVANENTHFVRGLCLEVHDLTISKLVAGREKDLDFARLVSQHGMVSVGLLHERLAETDMDERLREIVKSRIAAQCEKSRHSLS